MNTNNNTGPAPRGEQCQCAGCGLTFTGEQAFNRHRVGDFGLASGNPGGRRCLTLAEMASAGMEKTAADLWRIQRSSRNGTSEMGTAAPEAHAGVTADGDTARPLRTQLNRPVRIMGEAA